MNANGFIDLFLSLHVVLTYAALGVAGAAALCASLGELRSLRR